MFKKNCPGCGKRLPYASYWCRTCGWSREVAGGAAPRSRGATNRAFRLAMTVFGAMLLILVGRVVLTSETVVDWYADFAFERLPSMFTSVAPAESESGAYLFCVKRAARQVQDRNAIETFPSFEESELTRLEERRYRVSSFFDQRFDDGAVERRDFSCLVRYDRGRWVLEELQIDERRLATTSR